MYIRVTRRKNKDGSTVQYYQLAETSWDPQTRRPVPRIIHNFGRAERLDKEALQRLARSISRVLHQGVEVPQEVASPEGALEIEWARPLGTVHAIGCLWEELGMGEVLRRCQQQRSQDKKGGHPPAPHEQAGFVMVANRLLEPLSKLACHEQWLPAQVYLPQAQSLTLEQLYFAMDFLETHVEEVEKEIFFRVADLFRAEVDLVFFDTTTVYFETDKEDEAEQSRRGKTLPALRKRGYNKEGHEQDPQVVVGLAVTREGLPVRSWVFAGNTVDATTVGQVKEDLRGWKLGRAIFVGDAGMDSESNRQELAKAVGKYILAMPMGKLKEVQQEVLSRGGRFKKVNEHLEVKEVVVGEGERRRRYLVCRNLHEAQRQREHRQEVLQQLQEELKRLDLKVPEHSKGACELVASRRYGRYVKRGPGGKLGIDEEAVRKAQRMDGKYVLLTNDDTLTSQDVGQGYKAMMIIEACFRRMKTSGLRIRPVYHWTAHRIVSHVKLCVLALLIERAAELRCGDTWRNIRHALEEVKAVRYRLAGGTTVVEQTTRLSAKAQEYFKKLKVRPPKPILSIEQG